ncbi:hypothetical protein HMPREF3182_00404 [Megasphaera hutchinsoni]|uniref:Uncharacterized protein n=1 Tax=Megasphaera hutchinsoni TaxID=1588748 RepID=A0A134CJV8_9FIRM|nr:hypothetical protein HMPREF3182_00404 [Megasphaera hutchinsoni]
MAAEAFIFIGRLAACYCLKGAVTLQETRVILSYHEWKDRRKNVFKLSGSKSKVRNRFFK